MGKKMKDDLPKYAVWQNVFFLLKDMAKDYRLLLAFLVAEALFGIITPILGIYLPKVAVELVTEGADPQRVLSTLGVFIVALAIAVMIQNAASRAKYMHYNDMRSYYLRKLFYKTLDCDYRLIESAAGQTRYQKAMDTLNVGDWSGTSRMITSMLSIFTGTVSFLLFSSVIAMLNPWIVLLLALMSAVNYFALRYARNYEQNRKDELSAFEKKLHYIGKASGDITSGKDIRLYTMAGWFILLQRRILNQYSALKRKVQSRHFVSSAVNAFTLLLRDGVAYAYLIWCVTTGQIALADFVLYFGAIGGFSAWISQIVENMNAIGGANLQMNDMRAFLEQSDAPETDRPMAIPDHDSNISIEFKDVCFAYDREAGNVLEHLNMKIEAGEKIALVGVNGVGKTTIVKLLCGFYQPDSGEILLNGMNICHFRKKDLFTLSSAVFQDITILPFTVAENVTMKIDGGADDARVWACLEKAGLANVIRNYDQGIHTKMLKAIDESGRVLSGGEQQKLLMARALYKDAPILILDEPTAALDPIAESEVYESFHAFSEHKTAVYISHRLASTRFCDKIMMIDGGKIIECGTHAELMQLGGKYAEMFSIQSHYYNYQREEAVL